MTCQDCIHYNDKPHNLCKKWIMPLDRNNEPCKLFEPKDDLLKMRSATKEERESVNKYIDSISESTGHNFYDSWESVSK